MSWNVEMRGGSIYRRRWTCGATRTSRLISRSFPTRISTISRRIGGSSRIRDDKAVSEIDTLAFCRELAEAAARGWQGEVSAMPALRSPK